MTGQLPSWPTTPPSYGSVVLRAFSDEDAHLAVELGDDPYIPLIGSLPAHPTAQQALEWIHRQRGQLAERQRYSFAIADAESNKAVGAIGLGLQHLSAGRATAGYAVAPAHRGRGIATSALQALTIFAWTIPALYRVELYIEPWNTSSIHVAEASGYRRKGLLRSHQEIGGTGATCCCMRRRDLDRCSAAADGELTGCGSEGLACVVSDASGVPRTRAIRKSRTASRSGSRTSGASQRSTCTCPKTDATSRGASSAWKLEGGSCQT